MMQSISSMARRQLLRPQHGIHFRILMVSFGSSAPTQRPTRKPTLAETNGWHAHEDEGGKHGIPLTKRIDELGLCSPEKADAILKRVHDLKTYNDEKSLKDLKQIIYVRGEPVLHPGAEVATDEMDIQIQSGMPIRLSKRMSELGMCSRREATEILRRASECVDERMLRTLDEVIYLRGKPVMGGSAVKIPPEEMHIEIRAGDDPPDENEEPEDFEFVPYAKRPWNEIQADTIVLNKPIGYVSGQEEHDHVPAVRLLTKDNIALDHVDDEEQQYLIGEDSPFRFDVWKFAGFDTVAKSIPRHIRKKIPEDQLKEKRANLETLSGYAPAGRLDIDSTGVLIFTKAGVMARRLIEPKSGIRKEYIVKVQPAVQPTHIERKLGLKNLPRPTRDLKVLFRRGNRLLNERISLKPLVEAEWLDDVTMRFVMVEGKKRQIRRMCRELLGWHVVDLLRTSVGPVRVDSLPEGKWRPLTQEEVTAIFETQPKHPKKSKSRRKSSPASNLNGSN